MRSFRYSIGVVWALAACSVIAVVAAACAGAPVTLLVILGGMALAATTATGVVVRQTADAVQCFLRALQNADAVSLPGGKRFPLKPLYDALGEYLSLRAESRKKSRDRESEVMLRLQLLQRQKKNTEAIIYSIRDSVIVTDASDRIILANAAAEELFGFKLAREQAQPLGDAIGNTDFVNLIRRSRENRNSHVRHELTLDGGGGSKVFDCIVSCVEDENGSACGVVAVLHDITREKEISQMKNDFVSHVSHELKTPLASINAYAEMLVDGEAGDAETMNKFCAIIQSQAQRLNRLIEDILNISRIESGLIKVAKEPCSVAILAQNAVEMIKSYALEKNITVTAPAPIIHDQILADKDMITQVIINLLSNAVKYTPSGGSVGISVEVDEIDQQVRVAVTDTGVGIPAEDLPHVFEKFYRVEANKKQAKGTGLGLNLVKQIVETVHGGRVFVTSTPQKGSTFGFTLPLAAERVVQNV